jgi:hypothetical protein
VKVSRIIAPLPLIDQVNPTESQGSLQEIQSKRKLATETAKFLNSNMALNDQWNESNTKNRTG